MQEKLEKKRRIKEDYLPKEDRFHAIPAYCKQIRQKRQWSFRIGFTKFQDWMYKNPGLDVQKSRIGCTKIQDWTYTILIRLKTKQNPNSSRKGYSYFKMHLSFHKFENIS